MNFTYIAKRALQSGHSEDTAYSLDIGAREMIPRRSPVKNSVQAKDGTRETLHDRTDIFWDIVTGVVQEADLPAWEEFLASVEANEEFLFDPNGSADNPDDPRTVEMVEGYYTPERIEMTKMYRFNFRLREV